MTLDVHSQEGPAKGPEPGSDDWLRYLAEHGREPSSSDEAQIALVKSLARTLLDIYSAFDCDALINPRSYR
jgi:hypothetical protein